jgi:DNA-binding NarL/FixJ family response regulator
MARYDNDKTDTTRVLVHLRNRLFGEAVCRLLENELEGYTVRSVTDPAAGGDFFPHLMLVEAESLTRELFERWPDTKVILIDTGLPEGETIHLMRSYRLYGILSPEADIHQVRKAFTVIMDGQIWIDSAKLRAVLHGKETPAGFTIERLSDKESRIIELVTEGYKNREIASKLFLSEQTIKSHLGRIFRKMHVTNRSQLVSITLKSKNHARISR